MSPCYDSVCIALGVFPIPSPGLILTA